jgi:hypothetical protein
MDEAAPAAGPGDLVHGARWPVPPGARLTIGVRPADHICLPRAREAVLGSLTAYVLVRRDAPHLEIHHTGHIGHFRLGGRLHNTGHPPPVLALGDAVDLLTVDGELGLRLRLELA